MNNKSIFKVVCIALICTLLMTGCMTSVDESSQDINKEGDKTEKHQTETDTSQPTEEKSIEVDKGLLDVKITLPKSMFDDADMDKTIEEAKAKGVKEVKVNDDGSVTYIMSKKTHKAMLDEFKDKLVTIFDEAKGEEYESILDIEYNNDFSKVTLIVDKEKYQNSFDGFITMGIGLAGGMYQRYLGRDEVSIDVDIKDNATGEVFHTINYPQALEDFENIGTNGDE